MLFLFSCAKEGKNIYIEGRVLNPVTGEGIPNVKLLLKKVVSNIDLTTESKVKQEAISDADGNFILKHNGTGNFVVSVEFLDEGYHFVGWRDESGQTVGDYKLYVTKGEVMNVSLELAPYGFVRTWFHNVNCHNQNDSIVISRINEYSDYTPGHFSNVGCQNLEQLPFMKRPMGKIYIYYTVYRDNSGPINGIDTIFVGDGDSTTYLLEY